MLILLLRLRFRCVLRDSSRERIVENQNSRATGIIALPCDHPLFVRSLDGLLASLLLERQPALDRCPLCSKRTRGGVREMRLRQAPGKTPLGHALCDALGQHLGNAPGPGGGRWSTGFREAAGHVHHVGTAVLADVLTTYCNCSCLYIETVSVKM